MKTYVLIVLAAFTLSASVASHGKVTIAQIIGPDQRDISTPCPDVVLIKFSGEAQGPPQSGNELTNGDELQCPNGTVTVVISTSEFSDAQVHLTGRFRAALSIDGAGRAELIILELGSIDAIGDSTPAVKHGDTTFGPRGTHYAVAISDDPESPGLNLDVFDGAVEVSAPELETSIIGAGYSTRILKSRAAISPVPLAQSRISDESLVQARIDASRITDPNKRKEAVARLSANYAQILTSPANLQSRLALVDSQILYGASNPTTQYHLNQVRVHMGTNTQIQIREKTLRDQVQKELLQRSDYINPVKVDAKALKNVDSMKAQRAIAQ